MSSWMFVLVITRARKELSRKKHADLLYDIRRNAIKTMEQFIFIFEGMENATDKPGKRARAWPASKFFLTLRSDMVIFDIGISFTSIVVIGHLPLVHRFVVI